MAYSDRLSPKYMERVIWRALLAMESQAVELTQVDTGMLRDSITIATNKRLNVHGARAMFNEQLGQPVNDLEGVIGTNVVYAQAVEYGREDMENYPAHPYLRPALDTFRAKKGQITGAELKIQIALYNIEHPYKVKKYITGGK